MTTQNCFFLDVDGVLAEFHEEALRLWGRGDLIGHWPKGEWDMPGVIGVDPSDFWGRIDSQGSNFWADLDKTPWADELVTFLRSRGRVFFTTSPTLSADCVKGKMEWLRRHYGEPGKPFRDFFLTPHKEFLAGKGRWLVDDYPPTCKKWADAGGNVVQCPAMWNMWNEHYENPASLVAATIDVGSAFPGKQIVCTETPYTPESTLGEVLS